MTGNLNVERNNGIASTGDHADNKIIHLPPGGLRAADEVGCPARVAELGPHTAGRLFVGRDHELAALETALAEGPGVITTGLGGVGKSTLAHRYADTHRDRYNPIWWIDADEPEEIEAGLARLARRLYPDLALMPDTDAAAWGRAWLLGHEGWLVVLDNVNDPAHVADLVGTARGGHFVLTSRLTVGWQELAEAVPLDVLTPQQAFDLLARATGGGRRELLEGAEELCQALGYLPLAVRMAAAYMSQNAVTAASYLTRLTSRTGKVLEWTPSAGDPDRTIARIWLVSLQRITSHHGTFAQELLRVLAWFAPTDIPVPLLYALPDTSTSQIDEALGRLSAYALMTRDGDAVTVHRMVQTAARHTTTREPTEAQAVDTACRQAIGVLLEIAPPHSDPAGWALWRRLAPHIDALTANHGPTDNSALLALVDAEALYLEEQGQVARSIVLFEQNLVDCERVLGPEHPWTLTSRNNLAGAYESAGVLVQAIPLYEGNVVDCERVLGPDHRNTLTSRNNVAHAYRAAGNLSRAIPLYEHVVVDFERVLGPDHPDTLISRNNLAEVYAVAGDLSRAIPLYEQNLADRERVLGPDHPSTLASRNNLAYVYQAVGDLDRAIPLFEQILVDCERVLGPDHPHTLTFCNNLAAAYRAVGDLDRAIPLYEQNLADRQRVLGPDHPDTLSSRNNLAYAYRATGDLARAIPLYERNLAERERVLGLDHPDTQAAHYNLAAAYKAAEDTDQAEPN